MGLGRLFTRPSPTPAPDELRVVTDIGFGRGGPPGLQGEFYDGALRVPGAWRAATLLADMIGQLPWDLYRSPPGAGPVERLARPPLLEQPAPPESAMNTFAAWALDLLMHGNAVGVYSARERSGYPTAVLPVPAALVGVDRVGPGSSSLLPRGQVRYWIGERQYGPEDVLHVKGPSRPGELRGRGVLEQHLDTINLAREQARQAQSLSEHGVPTGTLKSTNDSLTEPEAEEMKARWLAAQRKRSIAVLNSTTEFQPLSWNPEELQLVEARKFSLHELALIFGVPAYFLGADTGSSLTYSNVEQEGLNLLKFTLGGHLARFEQALSRAFPRGKTVLADTNGVLRTDTLTRYRAHGIALDRGFMTTDEVREDEALPPMTPAQRAEVLQKQQGSSGADSGGGGGGLAGHGLGDPADNPNADVEES